MTVVFNYTAFSTRYPEFSKIPEARMQAYFDESTLYCDPTGSSRVASEGQRLTLLNMLTAHIAALNDSTLGKGATDPVGRISSVTQGSESSSFDNALPGTAAWFQATKYGVAFWQATAMYRTMRVFPGRSRTMDPFALI